jgi:hypothetical protein
VIRPFAILYSKASGYVDGLKCRIGIGVRRRTYKQGIDDLPRRISMLARVVVLLTAILALQALPAVAQEQDPREIQAQKDCLTGRADAGVALLAELYAVTGNPNFIYNQARCFEQASRPDDAISRFREYLRVAKDLPPAEQVDVEKHIMECRVLQAEQEREREKKAAAEAAAAAAAAPPPPAPTFFAPAAPEASNPQPAGLDLSTQPKAAESTPIYAKWWFWTGLVAIVGGGVTAYFLATRQTTQNACSGSSIPCDAIK